MMAAVVQHRIGFYGLEGFFGLFIGVLLMCVVIWAVWTIFDIVVKKFNRPEIDWLFQILRVLLILFTVAYFFNRIFYLGWF